MIRIDEIYTGTLSSWIQRNRPDLRLIYLDPFGATDPASLQVQGHILQDKNYVLFFDQEPLQLDLHAATFDRVQQQITADFAPEHWYVQTRGHARPAQLGHIVTSELNSAAVAAVCERYGWQSHYYWFHGWAALDWYRGYNRSGQIAPPKERTIRKTFVLPNRIIGGRRTHRLQLLYYVFKYQLRNNYISCPAVCPVENKPIETLLAEGVAMTDAVEVFRSVDLPLNMPGEQGHPMHSAQLSLFAQAADSLLYVVTETVATGRRLHLTEKTFKPICLQMPFVLVGTCGSLEYLRSYGFRTFGDIWDERYDAIEDDDLRIAAVAEVLRELDAKTPAQKQNIFEQCRDIVEHNYRHFYSGGFEQILWQEFNSMLSEL
jgi:hypothetical protein